MQKALLAQRARVAARQARDLTRRKNALGRSGASGQARRLLVTRPPRVGAVHSRGSFGTRHRSRTRATRAPRRSCRSEERS